MKNNAKKVQKQIQKPKDIIFNDLKANKDNDKSPIFDKFFSNKKYLPIYLAFLVFLIVYIIQFFSNEMFMGRIIFGICLFVILSNTFNFFFFFIKGYLKNHLKFYINFLRFLRYIVSKFPKIQTISVISLLFDRSSFSRYFHCERIKELSNALFGNLLNLSFFPFYKGKKRFNFQYGLFFYASLLFI